MLTLKSLSKTLKKYYVEFNNKRVSKFMLSRTKRRIIELKKTRTDRISTVQKKEAKEFFHRYADINTEFHEFYYLSTGTFDSRYIPDNLHYAMIDRFYNNWEKAKVLDNKTLYSVIFSDMPQPETLFYRAGGFWYDKENKIVSISNVLSRLSMSENFFIKKAEDSYGGHGVRYYNCGVEKKNEIMEIFSEWKCDVLVQKGIKQTDVLSSINSSSVNTIRIMTLLRKDGTVKVVSSILRMGLNGSKVDNASSGGITVGIMRDGRLKSIAYSVSGRSFNSHPNTGVIFESVIIPNFNKAIELVVNKAKVMPHFRLISWDVSIDCNDDPILIEANLRDGELDFHQLNNGPLYGEETESILDEVFGVKNI